MLTAVHYVSVDQSQMLKHHHFLCMGTDVLLVEEDKDHILKENNHNITGKEKEKAEFYSWLH